MLLSSQSRRRKVVWEAMGAGLAVVGVVVAVVRVVGGQAVWQHGMCWCFFGGPQSVAFG